VTVACFVWGPSSAIAGGNPDVSLGFHITSIDDDVSCSAPPALTSTTLVTDMCPEPDTELLVWLFACNATDSSGVAGIEIVEFTNCTDFQVPAGDWPNAGSGSRMSWSYSGNCQDKSGQGSNTVIAVAGVFRVVYHSPDRLRFVS